MKRMLLLMFFSVLMFGQLHAQQRVITGKVTDAKDGSPLPGVTVSIKGTTKGTITNANGEYRIEVSGPSDVLVYSFIGYGTQELAAPAGGARDVQLDLDDRTLQEVVVTGYVDIKKKDVTASTANIDGSKINNKPIQSFDQALDGAAAGVNVNVQSGMVGDAVAIRIRGVNSISNSAQPLIVLDGVPLNTATNLNVFNSGNGTRFNPLADINPNDIASVDVLKDAAAAALYGSRAANGVIVITTKRGLKGTVNVGYNTNLGWARGARIPKVLDGDRFIAIQNEKAANAGVANIAADIDVNGDGQPDRTNWIDEVFKTGFSQTHQLNFSGGGDRAQYYASAEYADMRGFVITNRLRRGSARLNLDLTPKTWLKAGISLYASRGLNNGVLSDGLLAGSTIAGYNAPPNVPIYNNTGEFGGYYLNPSNRDLGNGNNNITYRLNRFFHPLTTVYMGRNDNQSNRTLGNVYLEVTPVTGLKLTSRFGIDYIQNFEDQYSGPDQAGLGVGFNGLVQENLLRLNQWNWSNFASYAHTFAQQHNVTITAGVEYQYSKRTELFTGQGNLADSYFQNIYDGLFAGTDNSFTGGTANARAFDSYFGRLAYNYGAKYYAEFAFRADAYSGFGINNRRGYFPSGSIGWRIYEENFFKDNVDFVSDLKLRASYGVVGNSEIGPYAARTLYGGGQYADLNGLSMSQIGDPNLQWESSRKLDVGLDASFLRNRIGLVLDYFSNNVDKLVLDAPVLRTVGVPASAVTTNIGAMRNTGFEITVNATPVEAKNFTWATSANFTHLKNEVKKLVDGTDIISGSNRASVGRPLGVFYMIRWAGVNPETGYGMFYDKEGNVRMYNPGAPTADRWTTPDGSTKVSAITASDAVYLEGVTGYPTWYGGWDNTLSYKGFELNIQLQFSGGNSILNATRQGLMTNFLQNNITEIEKRWTPTNTNTSVPRLYLVDNITTQTSTRWLEKADYLRLKTVSLGYSFPNIKQKLGMNTLRLYVAGDNLALLTGYSGQDPEINTNRTANIAFGVDSRGVPLARTFSIGLNASF
ncbi:TonB-dependent receptor [Chitinophaga sp.]|uniref:SusC/RagA family TonB-linked outer membrane protein n=1 Tax=Chitinophaga sp. TaxID=1869181 RepID=UPI0031D731E7